MIKYFFEYTNVVGDFFRVEILSDSYQGLPLLIKGNASLELAGNKDFLEPFKGMALKLNLEANKDLDFTDLYTEKETEFKVNFYRNDNLLYKGFIKPDGLFADFVDDNWIITLDSIDGLGILENLRFVKEDGLQYTGLMSEMDIIIACLNRTGIYLPINTRLLLYHDGMDSDPTEDVLGETYLNTERFIKDVESSEEQIMDCAEVLKSILVKYNAVIQQQNGEWFIYRPIDYFLQGIAENTSGNSQFFRYSTSGGSMDGVGYINLNQKIGSNIDGYYPHHASANQRLTIEGAVSAFRVKYKYGLVKLLTENKYFENLSNPLNGWDVNTEIDFTQTDGKGLKWNVPIGITPDTSTPTFQFNDSYEVKLTNNLTVVESDNLQLNIAFFKSGYITTLRLKIKLVTDSGTFYYRNDGWKDFSDFFNVNSFKLVQHSITNASEDRTLMDIPLSIPEEGILDIEVYAPKVAAEYLWQRDSNETDYAEIYSLDVTPLGSDNDFDGESHTALRKPANSSNIEDSIEVFNGDMDSDIFVGALKKEDGENTKWWSRVDKSEEKELLQIMVEDRIRMQSKPMVKFSGDVYGFVPSLKYITINNINGTFIPISYSYDSVNNLCNFEMLQIFGNELQGEIEYNKSYDRGNVVKPTIEG